MNELFYWTAVDMAAAIRQGHVSVREVIQAHVDRIQQVNPVLNALVSQQLEQALTHASEADAQLAAGVPPGPLFGVPVAHKDSFLTRGIRTTFGSRAFENFIPDEDSAVVARQKAAGAIVMGKTNMPELGAGSHTFNEVFGITRNPYCLDVSAGGSSGGSAAALAAGMVALADGSDMGGSLRNPASFCNIVGLRPSIGRIPMAPVSYPFNTLTTGGPMGRSVGDVALMLDVLAGDDPRDPLAIESYPGNFFPLTESDLKGRRIAVSRTVGGLPFDSSVQDVLQSGLGILTDLGCIIEEAEPDFSDADLAFETLRAFTFATSHGTLGHEQRALLKETVRWNIDLGLELTGTQVMEAERARARMFARMKKLLEQYDFLVAPVSQVVPFPVEQEYPRRVGDSEMSNYIEWMKSCSRITITGHPALSLPSGFTPEGLPVGIQIIGGYRKERELLAFAQVLESVNPVGRRQPPLS